MKQFFAVVFVVSAMLSSNAQADFIPVPEQGPEWLVGPAAALPGIWAKVPSVETKVNTYLDPVICGRIFWGDWGGRSCAHGIALMLGDMHARAELCGKPEDHTPALHRLVGSAAYSFGGRSQFDIAAVLDAYPAQYNKIHAYLQSSPTLRLDCIAVANQTKRITEFVASFLAENLARYRDLPPVLQDQHLPRDGGNNQPTLWNQQTQTLFRQAVEQEALDDRAEMLGYVNQAAVQHLSAALDAAKPALPYHQQSLQTQYEYINQSEALTRGPSQIRVQLAESDNRIGVVSGLNWTELLVPTRGGRQGGLNVVVQLIWQGGGDACLVQVNAFGVIDCAEFMTEAGMPPFIDAVQKARAR